ncbi:MAG: Uma2 family endonuclease [Egibacteraceae bacterium]
MAIDHPARLTYADLQAMPEDHLRRELIDGELFVSPSPVIRHQLVAGRLHVLLYHYAEDRGGLAFQAPTDVYFAEDTVVVPDVLYVRPEHLSRVEERFVRSAPDLVVEVSSPSTRSLDSGRKRALYEWVGVAEYWFVDLRADHILAHRRHGGGSWEQLAFAAGDTLTSPVLPGLKADVDAVLAPLPR